MFQFYKALNFRANKINEHEILALFKKSIYEKKREYFPNVTIDFFLVKESDPPTLHCAPVVVYERGGPQ